MTQGATPVMDFAFSIECGGEVYPATLSRHDLKIGIALPLRGTDGAPCAAFHMIGGGIPNMILSTAPLEGLQSALVGLGKQLAPSFMCQMPK